MLMDGHELLPDFPQPITPLKRIGHVAVKYGKYMVVWGGYCNSSAMRTTYLATNELLVYEPLLEKWKTFKTSTENAPRGTSGACGLVHNESLYIFGGYCNEENSENEDRNTNEIYSLDLTTLTWRNYRCIDVRPIACDKMVGWVHEGRLFYFGGFGLPPSHSSSSKVIHCEFCYDEVDWEAGARGWNNQLVMFDPNTIQWKWPLCQGHIPSPRAAHAAAKIKNKVYIFGGRHRSFRMNDLYCLDLDTLTWSGRLACKGELPKGRSWHTFTPISDTHIVLYGGFTQNQEALSDCWMLSLSNMTWTQVPLDSNRPRLWHTACLGDEGEIIIFGGCVGNILNPRAPREAEEIITLWFSPKSLFRLALDVVIKHKEQLESIRTVLPLSLWRLFMIKADGTP